MILKHRTTAGQKHERADSERVSEFGKLSNKILCVGTPHTEDTIYNHLEDVGYVAKIPVIRTRQKQLADSTTEDEEYLAWQNHPQGMFTHKWLEQQRMETTEGDFNCSICLYHNQLSNRWCS